MTIDELLNKAVLLTPESKYFYLTVDYCGRIYTVGDLSLKKNGFYTIQDDIIAFRYNGRHYEIPVTQEHWNCLENSGLTQSPFGIIVHMFNAFPAPTPTELDEDGFFLPNTKWMNLCQEAGLTRFIRLRNHLHCIEKK